MQLWSRHLSAKSMKIKVRRGIQVTPCSGYTRLLCIARSRSLMAYWASCLRLVNHEADSLSLESLVYASW